MPTGSQAEEEKVAIQVAKICGCITPARRSISKAVLAFVLVGLRSVAGSPTPAHSLQAVIPHTGIARRQRRKRGLVRPVCVLVARDGLFVTESRIAETNAATKI